MNSYVRPCLKRVSDSAREIALARTGQFGPSTMGPESSGVFAGNCGISLTKIMLLRQDTSPSPHFFLRQIALSALLSHIGKKFLHFSKFDVYILVLANAYIIEAEIFATRLAETK